MDNDHGGAADGNPSNNKPTGGAESRGDGNPNDNKKAEDGEKSSAQDDPAEDKSSSEEEKHRGAEAIYM